MKSLLYPAIALMNRLSFGTPEYRTKCIKITAEAADMVSDYLQEKGLVK